MMPAVYLQTNDAARNEVLAFSRAADGSLSPAGRHPSGGRGSGQRHLASAGSVVLSPDLRWLLVTNAGSNELSLFVHSFVLFDFLPETDRALAEFAAFARTVLAD